MLLPVGQLLRRLLLACFLSGDQFLEALFVVLPLFIAQVRVTLGEFLSKAGLIRLDPAFLDEFTDLSGDGGFNALL
jgi:hypothetical protein